MPIPRLPRAPTIGRDLAELKYYTYLDCLQFGTVFHRCAWGENSGTNGIACTPYSDNL